MPNQENSHLYQFALLWAWLGTYDDYGRPQVSDTPVQVNVRWNNTRREVLDKQGNTIALDATADVDRDVPMGSWMWLGSLEDWLGTGSGTGTDAADLGNDVMLVKMFDKKLDVKGRAAKRNVGLMRLHGKGAN